MAAALRLTLRGQRRLPRKADPHAAPGTGAGPTQQPGPIAEAHGHATVLHRLLDPRQRQIVRRSINEHVRELSHGFAARHDVEFLCECTRPDRLELVSLSPAVYEQIRSRPTRFLTKPGHADDHYALVATDHMSSSAPLLSGVALPIVA